MQVEGIELADDAAGSGVAEHKHAALEVLDALELIGRGRGLLQPLDFVHDFAQRVVGVGGGHVGVLAPVAGAVVGFGVAVGRVSVAFVLANVARNTRAERAAKQRVHHLHPDEIGVAGVDHRQAHHDGRLRRVGPVLGQQVAPGNGLNYFNERGRALGKVFPGAGDGLAQHGCIKQASGVHTDSLRPVLVLVEILHHFQRQSINLGIGRQWAAVGVTAVECPRKFLAGLHAGLSQGQLHLPFQVGFEARNFGRGQGRAHHHIGQQRG